MISILILINQNELNFIQKLSIKYAMFKYIQFVDLFKLPI